MNKTIEVLRDVINKEMQEVLHNITTTVETKLDEMKLVLKLTNIKINPDLHLNKEIIFQDRYDNSYGYYRIEFIDFEFKSSIHLYDRGKNSKSKLKAHFYAIHVNIEEIIKEFNNA